MIEKFMKILDDLLKGKINITKEDLLAIGNETVRIMQTDTENPHSLKEFDITELGLIVQISNILYNDTDRSILPLDDGVYDLMIECYKKYNPQYQVGAVPIAFDQAAASTVNASKEFIIPIMIPDQDYVNDSFFINNENIGKLPPYDARLYSPKVNEDAQEITKRNLNTPHMYPKLVGTLDKAKFVLDKEAIDKGVYDQSNVFIFERDFLAKHLQAGLIDSKTPFTVVCELKYDGNSLEADVTNEILSARTRGDTNNDVAGDMTPVFKGYQFPYAPEIPIEEAFGMKFEAIMSYQNLEKFAELKGIPYKNARVAINGIFGSSDAARYRDFITLVPLATSIEGIDRVTEIEFMNKYFQTGIYLQYAVITGTYNEVLFQVRKFVQEAEYIRPYMPFMYDGVVVSYIDEKIISALGRQNSVNKYSIAIKFNPLKKQSVFTGYTFTVGQNGVITPMVHYTPVEFYGAIHTKSTAHSYARFRDLALRDCDILDVEYVNDVMPYVSKPSNSHNDNNQSPLIEFPNVCPVCGAALIESASAKSVSCPNIKCPGRQIARMTNMLKKLNMKDFSDESLLAIKATSLKDIMNVSLAEAKAALGEANGMKFIERVCELSTLLISDYRIVGSIGFSDIAIETWRKILNKIPLSVIADTTFDDFELIATLVQIKGIGKNTARTIAVERKEFYEDLLYVLSMPNVVSSFGEAAPKSIRFTGFRDRELEAYLKSLGYDADGDANVTKSTDILIVPEPGHTSSKTAKVGENTIIVDVEEFKSNMQKYLL